MRGDGNVFQESLPNGTEVALKYTHNDVIEC